MNTLQRQSSMNMFHQSNMQSEYPTHDDTGYHTGGYDNVGSESESEQDDVTESRLIAAVGMIKPKPKKRKMDPLEQSINGIKRLCTDAEMIARVQSFYFALEEEKRKALGDEIHWQIADDTSTHDAMLADTVNIIMQARKAIMSRDNEGVKITIEQGGFHDPKTRIRPKYCINIERVKV